MRWFSVNAALRGALSLGTLWGVGHTLTVLLVGGAIVAFGLVIPARVGLSLELLVAVMLVTLGVMNFSRAGGSHAHPHRVPAARPVALVPKTAIRAEGDQSYAYVVSSAGVIDRRAVRVGGTDGDRVEVVAGLTAGEQVVISPPPTLASGARVVVQ